jgi:hypothetical protein
LATEVGDQTLQVCIITSHLANVAIRQAPALRRTNHEPTNNLEISFVLGSARHHSSVGNGSVLP